MSKWLLGVLLLCLFILVVWVVFSRWANSYATSPPLPKAGAINSNHIASRDNSSSPVDRLPLATKSKEPMQQSGASVVSPVKIVSVSPVDAVRITDGDVQLLLSNARAQNRLAEFGADLALSGSREDIATLLRAIELCTDEEREGLARSLQALHSSEASAELISFMVRHSDNPDVAVQTRDALARVATGADVMNMSQMLPSNPEQGLARSYILGTLGRARNPEAVPELAALCLHSENTAIYTSAAIALGGIGSPEAVSSLIELIETRAITDINDPLAQSLLSVTNKDARSLLERTSLVTANPIVKSACTYALDAIRKQSTKTVQIQGIP